MTISKSLIPVEHIQSRILLIRGHKVIIDADLAELYGVTTKRLNEQVRRDSKRFPSDFMFQLTKQEKGEVVAIWKTNRLQRWQERRQINKPVLTLYKSVTMSLPVTNIMEVFLLC